MLDAHDGGPVEQGVKPLYANGRLAPKASRTRLWKALLPLRFTISLTCFLTVILYFLFVMIFQGIGMLGMYLVMPSFMRLVYPSRLGQLHSIFLSWYRGCFIGEEGHSRSIRVDFEGAENNDETRDLEDGVGALRPYSVHTVACLTDNYAYVIVDRSTAAGRPHAVALVDPCEAKAVVRCLTKLNEEDYASVGLQVVAILTTHHHWDHAGGNRALAAKYPNAKVYGGRDDVVAGCTHKLGDGDELMVGSLPVRVLHAPCHTRGSLCYVLDGPTPSIFGGDTLFCGGCGAPFEGTQAEMAYNFGKIWRSCSLNTLIFPGHEYSMAILPGYLSGQQPLPDHPAAFGKIASLVWRGQSQRALNSPVPTVPLVLADELLFNINFAPLRRAAETLANAYIQSRALAASSRALEQQPEAQPPSMLAGAAAVASDSQSAHHHHGGFEMMGAVSASAGCSSVQAEPGLDVAHIEESGSNPRSRRAELLLPPPSDAHGVLQATGLAPGAGRQVAHPEQTPMLHPPAVPSSPLQPSSDPCHMLASTPAAAAVTPPRPPAGSATASRSPCSPPPSPPGPSDSQASVPLEDVKLNERGRGTMGGLEGIAESEVPAAEALMPQRFASDSANTLFSSSFSHNLPMHHASSPSSYASGGQAFPTRANSLSPEQGETTSVRLDIARSQEWHVHNYVSAANDTEGGVGRAGSNPRRGLAPVAAIAKPGYWSSGGVAIVGSHDVMLLERSLRAEGATKSLAMLHRLRALGTITATTAAEGAPVHARVAHADPPRFSPGGYDSLDFAIVTTDEVKTAFELLATENVPGHARGDVLRRAVTCPLLLRKPLEKAQADELFRIVGVDGRGLVSCARFNGQMGVLPPMPPPAPRPGCCRRFLSRLRLAKTPTSRYEDADLSDDGTLGSNEGLRPIAM